MKKTVVLAIFAFVFSALPAVAQKKDAVLMKVNGKPVTKSEFEAIFKKNNRDSVITQQSLDEYVKLFTNFKLKVAEAEELGMDTLKKFKEELAGYRKQLAKPYLVDNNLNDELVTEAYERMKWEVRASHILIKVDQDAAPEDTLKAWKKIMAIRDRIVAGADFGDMAVETARDKSGDESAIKNKGDLGYFTSMQMVYPFENVAFNTNIGEVSKPVRTRFGYHLVKVTDKRAARGNILTAHILIAVKDDEPAEKKENARMRAQEILDKVKQGEDFATLARQFSDDQSSKARGGELPWFGPGRMLEEYETAAFNLKNNGDVSELVKTDIGYHIIKRIDLKTLEPFDKMKGDLKMRISRDSRSYLPQVAFVNKLKKKYKYKYDKKALSAVTKTLDSTVFKGSWDISKASGLKKKLFSFDKKVYTQADFANYIAKNQRRDKKQDMSFYTNTMFDRFVSEEILAFEDSKLEDQYSDFRLLMKEYRDGILLFDLTDKKVWSKAVKDTAGLRAFYEKNKMNYMHGTRYDVEIYTCKVETIAYSVMKSVQSGTVSEADLEAIYNKDSKLNLRIEKGLFSEADRTVLKNIQKPGIYGPVNENGQFIVVKVTNIIQPVPKTLYEAKGPVTSDYQDFLEQEWLTQLRAKYKVEIDQQVLYSIK